MAFSGVILMFSSFYVCKNLLKKIGFIGLFSLISLPTLAEDSTFYVGLMTIRLPPLFISSQTKPMAMRFRLTLSKVLPILLSELTAVIHLILAMHGNRLIQML